jgi:hypothetical protein
MARNISTTNFVNVLIKSDHPFFNFTEKDRSRFDRFVMYDSVIRFFPYLEIYTADYSPRTAELLLFSEGLEFTVIAGNDLVGQVVHDFYWEDTQLSLSIPQEHISGTWIWTGISRFRKDDGVKSASYKDEPYKIARDIYLKYKFPAYPQPIISSSEKMKKIFTSKTNNYGIWYQANELDSEFVTKLANHSYVANQQGRQSAPFYTFINNAGDFYFMDIWSMIQQPSVATYTLYDKLGHKSGILAHNYQIIFAGASVNMNNYNKTFIAVDGKGDYFFTQRNLVTQNISYGKKPSGHPILKKDISNVRQDIILGVVNNAEDRFAYAGRINNEFIDTHTSYRIRMTVDFNPKLAAGRVIELEVPSGYTEDKFDVPELSGKWIIQNSQHIIPLNDASTGVGFTYLEVFKPSLHIYEKNVMYKDYIKG